jgi:hypothetical protein
MNLKRVVEVNRKEHRAAKPQPKAGRTYRGIREIRGKQTPSRFAFRVFRVFRGSLLFAPLLWSHP